MCCCTVKKLPTHSCTNNRSSISASPSLEAAFHTILENVAIANALQLEAARRHAVPVRSNTSLFIITEECRAATSNRRKALQKVKVCPTSENIENYRIIRAKARRTIKSTRRQCWQSYVCKINSRTSLKKVWSMVRKISNLFYRILHIIVRH